MNLKLAILAILAIGLLAVLNKSAIEAFVLTSGFIDFLPLIGILGAIAIVLPFSTYVLGSFDDRKDRERREERLPASNSFQDTLERKGIQVIDGQTSESLWAQRTIHYSIDGFLKATEAHEIKVVLRPNQREYFYFPYQGYRHQTTVEAN